MNFLPKISIILILIFCFKYGISQEMPEKNELITEAEQNIKMMNYRKAMILFLKTIEKAKTEKDEYSELRAYRGIGQILKEVRDYEHALDYFDKHFQIAKKLNLTKELYYVKNDIALTYLLQKKYKKALDLFVELQTSAFNTKDTLIIAGSSLNIGLVNLYQKKYDDALKYYGISLFYSRKLNNINALSLLYSHIAYANCWNGRNRLALQYLDSSNTLAKTNDLKSILLDNVSAYAMIYDSLKMNDSAIKYYREVMRINDTLNNNQETALVSQIIQESIEEEMKKEIELLQQEKEITSLRYQQLTIIFSATGVLLILLTVFVFLYFRQIKLKKEKQTLVLEKQILRLQMNPHFISNALVAIQSFVFSGDKNLAGKYISDFSKLMRVILYKSRNEYISLKEELEVLNYYLGLQKLRFEGCFEYEIITTIKSDPEQIQIPSMLTQPFIENAIEHGLALLKTPGKLTIRFTQQNGSLFYEVIDNGIGREASKKIKDNKNKISQSTEITESRLRLLNKGKKEKITIEICDLFNESEPSGTKVSFTIPTNLK